MKNLLTIFFILASFSSFAQITKMGGVASRVNDSTTYVTSPVVTQAHTDGYSDIWFSNTSNLWWVWDASAYVNWEPTGGGSFWPLTGTGTATGSIIIEGGGTPNELTIQNFDQIDLASNGGFGLTAQDLTVGVVDGMVFNASNGDMHFQTVNNKLTLEGDTLELENFVAGIRIDGNFGTAGQALTSNGPGAAPTWETPAGGGGGATAAGATGNVQYKSNGGGLQAEAAFSYDSATNLLTVPSVTAGSSTSLTDGAAITITGTKHTLTSTQPTVTWTFSQTGDYQTTDIILNATTTTYTFPANTLAVYEGVASGDNTAVLSGTSGDHYIMSTYKDGTNYRVVIKNFGQ